MLELEHSWESPADLVNRIQTDSGLALGLRFCVSNKFPGDAVGPGTRSKAMQCGAGLGIPVMSVELCYKTPFSEA